MTEMMRVRKRKRRTLSGDGRLILNDRPETEK